MKHRYRNTAMVRRQSLVLLVILASVPTTSVLGRPSSWCDNNEAERVYGGVSGWAGFLPDGGIDMIDYAFDKYGNWIISGKDLSLGEYKLWRLLWIDDWIDDADDILSHTWSGLYYDDYETALYATDSENNMVYRFVRRSFISWDSDVVVSGQGNGSSKLDQPAGIRKFGSTLYIVQTGGRDNTVVSWDIGSNKRNFKFSFSPTGKFGIDVWNGYIFYRGGDDAVYKKSLYSPAGRSELVVGGCGAGSNVNQITNAGTGALRVYSEKCDLIVWDFTPGANRFVEWDDRWCSAAIITTTKSKQP
ncbi:hypothetical protein FOL47_003345 [Perkinsus chesapeaki]|uniref:DUF5050 domain-containing protein n=1 Tax=Perkinsus chesapeaki TaxID=330153 RepID=A0A7J6M8S3_PERCH|nr:hypothetical protein FOL47_003345 [Perkinsus chesapeaki]